MNPILAFGRAVTKTFFRDVVVEGRSNLPGQGPVIFTPNHPNGLLDPLLLFFLSPPFRLCFVAKAPLFKIPVFGALLRSFGAIPVMRKMDSSGEVDYTSFFSACVESLKRGDCIVIFPEGRSLPQAYLAPLKTGPARLFFLAREAGAPVKIIPIGLNYEKSTVFRSDVLIAIAPPVDTADAEQKYAEAPKEGVHELTDSIEDSLKNYIVQTETYRDRELMLLLERIYGEVPEDENWAARFQRLKQFEYGLARLRSFSPQSLTDLRNLLIRYERLSGEYRLSKLPPLWLMALLPVAALGWILNWVPYHLVDLLVRKSDASDAATFKVVYSLFAFPLTYAAETFAIAHWSGAVPAVLFALLIIPLSYFSQYMLDWWEEHSPRFWTGTTKSRISSQLSRMKERIIEEVELLAAMLEKHE